MAERILDFDPVDILLARLRQRLVIMLIDNGQVSPEEGFEIFRSTLDQDVVRRDREAYESGDEDKDSPTNKLGTILLTRERCK